MMLKSSNFTFQTKAVENPAYLQGVGPHAKQINRNVLKGFSYKAGQKTK